MCLRTWKILKMKPPLKLFDKHSTKEDIGKFQMLIASYLPDGKVQMVLSAIEARTNAQPGSFLYWRWSYSSWMQYTADIITLDEAIYSKYRQEVITQLGKDATKLVMDVTLT